MIMDLGWMRGQGFVFKNWSVTAILFENITSSMTYWGRDYYQWAYPHIRAALGWEKYSIYLWNSALAYTTPDLLAMKG